MGDELVEVMNVQLEKFKLILSNRRGATRLLSKVEADQVPRVDQLRPITLLNCDYKLLTMILSNRLVLVLPEVITSGQLCTVRGKSIHTGTTNLLSSAMYLVRVLTAMGFGDTFTRWITMLHEEAETSFILNFLTRPVKIILSLRQGDPLAMILFLLYVEPLLILIRRSTGGLTVLGLNSYARRLERHEVFTGRGETLVEDPMDLVTIDSIFVKFEACSGALLNRTCVLTLGTPGSSTPSSRGPP